MVTKLMDHRVTNFLNDLCFRSTEAKDRPFVDGDTGWQLTSWLKKRLLVKRETLVEP